jgi:hypothetical protein
MSSAPGGGARSDGARGEGGAPDDSVPCARLSPTAIVVGARTEVENGLRYRVADSPLSICVEQTGWPRSIEGVHSLSTSFVLHDGREEARFTPGAGEFIAWSGHKITFGVARASHTAPRLWIQVERLPPNAP